MARIGEGLARVRAGTETFDQFAREHAGEFLRMAKYVARRWRMPQWCDERDLAQEITLACWEFTWRWEPHRDVSLERYVTYNALDRAKKRAHKVRGAVLHGNAGCNPSRFELTESSLRRASFDDGLNFAEWVDAHECTQPDHEEVVERSESFARAGQHLLDCEKRILEHLREAGSLARAADQVWRDPVARRHGGIGSREQAARAVVRVAAKVAESVAPEELRQWMEAS